MARGSITRRAGKHGDSWTIRVDMGVDAATGKRRQRRETVATKREAEHRLAELLALANQQQLVATPKATLSQFSETWLRDHVSTRSAKTQAVYGDSLRRHILPHLGTVRLDRLTPSQIAQWLTTLRETPCADREGTLSLATVNIAYRVLRAALNTAVKWQLLARSPMDGVEAPRIPHKEMRTLDVEQAQRFLAAGAGEGVKWQCYFTMLLHTGCRPGELRALRWEDLDLTAGTMHVQRTVQRLTGRGLVVGQTKTATGRRPIALGADVVALLRRHRAEQNAERLSMGPLWQDHGLVFASEVGTFLEAKAMRLVFLRICERARVPAIRPYDLRHTSASLLLAAGVHAKVVSERLGHSNITLTLTTYSHTLPGLQRDAAETLETLLRGASGGAP